MVPDNCMSCCAAQTPVWHLSAEEALRDADGLAWAIVADSVLDPVGASGASTSHGIARCLSGCRMFCFRKSWRAQGSCTVVFLSVADA
jgi:hypothetical protein